MLLGCDKQRLNTISNNTIIMNVKEVAKQVKTNNKLSDSERSLTVKLYRIMSNKGEYDLTSLKKKLKEIFTIDELTASLAWLYFHDFIVIKKIMMNREDEISALKYCIITNKERLKVAP